MEADRSIEETPMLPDHTLIFDFDGTLADTLPRLVAISNRLAPEFGYRQVLKEDIVTLRGKRSREVLRHLKVPLFKIPALALRIKAELQQEIHLVPPSIPVRTVLEQLKSHYRLGIVTSNSVVNVNKFLEANRMVFFDFVRSSSGLFGKGQTLSRVLKEKRLSKSKTLYVGDEVRDIEAARQCGIETIAVTWGANDADKLSQFQPRFLIHQPEELLTILANWKS